MAARRNRRSNRRRNPMPVGGALFLLKNGRHKNKGKSKARRAKRSVSFGRIFARLKNRRKNGVAVQANPRRNGKRRNRNPLAIRVNGRRSNKRRNGKLRNRNPLAIRVNGRLRKNRRRNGVALRTNPMQLGFLSPVTGIISRIPVVGKMAAPIVGAGISAALVLGVVHLGMQYAMPLVPAQVSDYVAPVGYTVGGALLGALVAFVPSSMLSPASKATIASIAIVGGGAVDAVRYLSSGDSAATAGLGDGGLWQLGADEGDGMIDADDAALMSEYGDAEALDAMSSGEDLDSDEGEAALAGPRAWRSRFPSMRRMTHTRGKGSRHAGKHGHRWGWLIKLIGVKRFRMLAAQPAQQRVAYIKELRKFAISKVEEAAAEVKMVSGSSSGQLQPTAGWGALLIAQ